MHQLSNEQREQIEKLAYWFRAEQERIQRPDSPSRAPFSSLRLEPLEC